MRGLANDPQHAPHLVEAATGSVRTKHRVGVRTGQRHPGANPVELLRRVCQGLAGAAVSTASEPWALPLHHPRPT